ncbi:MAG TPA: DUF3616 domain-containing protein, partial [Verrucomicrobiota bacterium]|nr:DUF3616 domain-containing protein [Verrucomicrobiota bacterium]
MRTSAAILVLAFAAAFTVCGQQGLSTPALYTGTCDASAAAALDNDRFVIGNDEDNVLRVYSRSRPGPPVWTIDLSDFLGVKKSVEADIEGATRVGDRIYWISSHGRNEDGELRPGRQRFFATQIVTNDAGVVLAPVDRPCATLLEAMVNEPALRRFNLAQAAQRGSKQRGTLSIEGLSASPEGGLLIGFRSPVPDGKALLLPLLNPEELLQGGPARFGAPILLDLGGLGIRSIEWEGDGYWIIAGHHDDDVPSRLYFWKGGSSPARWARQVSLSFLNPESTLSFVEGNKRQYH